MAELLYYFKKALSMPANILVKKVYKKINTKWQDKIQKKIDLTKDTHIKFNVPIIKKSYININELDVSGIDKKLAQYLSKMYCEHRFDLLGSGWVKNSYDSIALGVEGYKYQMNVPVETSKYKAENYNPIDWQKDYKSGYRWSVNTWYKDIKYGHRLGLDIKVPWELARMQHLSQLAIFSLVDENLKEQNLIEFKNQILDFIATNPPRMGVNWVCTMDVGIRAANVLVAYDMFKQLDSFGILDDDFKQIFANSIYEHGLHIVNNLEYSEWLTSNHYLSDIAGLSFISAYLENRNDINQWLAFSIQEIINEMKKQFYEDGGNFESSTSYHRLSGELMIYSTALILGLKEDKINALLNYSPKGWKVEPKLEPLQRQQFTINNSTSKIDLPQWFVGRLYKIGRFTVDITKPDGEIPQFGDNDSGRFFRFTPVGEFITNQEAEAKYLNLKGYLDNLHLNAIKENKDDLYWDENVLNHSTFTSCFAAFFKNDIFKEERPLETSIIKTLSRNSLLKVNNREYPKIVCKNDMFSTDSFVYSNKIEYNFENDLKSIKFIGYFNSGIYIFKNDYFYLAICATPLGQNNNGGHTHNDKLAYELWYNGENLERDPGTYLYTPLPYRRNEFRSIKAHNVPIVNNIEQNSWSEGKIGLFKLFKDSECYITDLDNYFLEMLLEYKYVKIVRKFKIEGSRLVVIDTCNKNLKYNMFNLYSKGYGRIEKV